MLTNKCFLCLKENKKQIKVCSKMGLKLKLTEIIKQHFWLQPSQEANDKEGICLICWNIVRDFHEFYETIAEAHNYFQTASQTENLNFDDELPETELKLKANSLENLPQVEATEKISVVEIVYPPNCGTNQAENREKIKINSNDTDNDSEFELPLSMLLCTKSKQEYELDSESKSIIDILLKTKEEIPSDLLKFEFDEHKALENESVKSDFNDYSENLDNDAESINSDSSDYSVHLSDIEEISEDKRKKQAIKQNEIIGKFFEQLQCPKCDLFLRNFDDLRKHANEMHKSNCPSTTCCGRRFFMRRTLAEHALMHLNPDSLQCSHPKCDKIFKNNSKLQKHEETHKNTSHKLQNFQCKQCSKAFSSKKNLNEHQAGHASKSEYKFTCNECGLKYATKRRLRQHTKDTHCQSSICDICGKVVSNRKSLARHMLTHTEDSEKLLKPCQCDICGKWLKQSNSLRQHKYYVHEQHTEEKCSICDKKFANLRYLENHMIHMHKEERKYQCKMCDRAFKKQYDLKAHINLHTKEVIFTCEFCSKQFIHRGSLHKHKSIFHPKNQVEIAAPVQCKICNAWLKTLPGLKHHMKYVHEESKSEHRCYICNRVSVNALALRRHIKRNHGSKLKAQKVINETQQSNKILVEMEVPTYGVH